MSLTLELLRMETDREPMFWPFNAGNGLISAVPHDCPKAKKATTNTTADPALVNNNNNNNASTKVLNGLSQHKRHSYCKFLSLSKELGNNNRLLNYFKMSKYLPKMVQ